MRHSVQVFISIVSCLTALSAAPVNLLVSNTQSAQATIFEDKLNTRVVQFDTSGRTLLTSLIDLAYEHELPMGIEYLDREAATRPINLELHNESVRGILLAIVQQVPEYKVSFSDGVVDVYAPKARQDPSNLLNKVIKNFTVSELDTHQADMELFCALTREVTPSAGCGGSIAIGQWGPLRLTLHLQNAKVFEIANAMTAQNGKAIWTVTAPPSNLSRIPVGGLWHIYPLEPPFREAVLDKLTRMAGDVGGST
jgi:hypothetical protein